MKHQSIQNQVASLSQHEQALLAKQILRSLDSDTEADIDYCIEHVKLFIAECEAEEAHQEECGSPEAIAYNIAEQVAA